MKWYYKENIDTKGTFYIYILKCCNDKYYVGQTKHLINRMYQHITGNASKFTKINLPCALIHLEVADTRRMALKREGSLMKIVNNNRPFNYNLPNEYSDLFYRIMAMVSDKDLTKNPVWSEETINACHEFIDIPVIDWDNHQDEKDSL
jgi:putative endonuclease